MLREKGLSPPSTITLSSSSSSLSPPLPSTSISVEPLSNTEEVYNVIETIYSGNSTFVTRASHGNRTYIIKSNVKLLHNSKKIRKYFKEYSIGSSIHSPFVVKYCDFKRLGYGFAIIMDDIHGVPLRTVIPPTGFSLVEFLEIALKIAEGLEAIHNARVAHKDINPANIIVNMDTKQVNIIDFGKSSQCHGTVSAFSVALKTRLPRGSNPIVKGSFVYISPEQTGRINSVVDYRTDIYSLGVTFYEMLTGAPPFGKSDPLDLIYKHMAVHPEPLNHVKPQIGTPISDIVAKMLAKNAEDRYQDCRGLLSDLVTVQKSIETKTPLEGFVAGTRDLLRLLRISQKLYGRENEKEILTNNFKLICNSSPEASTMVLIHGGSGIGKTMLVHEVYKPLTKQNGYYVSGKFEQFMTPSPLSALVQATRQLVQQILTESEESLMCWKEQIQHGVGENGQLVVDIIPELELIIGPQAPVQLVGTIETIHRFNFTVSSFIFSLAAKHPLVIFLDDLQWADSNTFSFLTTLLDPSISREANFLFVVGAYRDNEVPAHHPLNIALLEVEKKGGKFVDILLRPLKECQVMQLLEDTFNMHTKVPSLRVDTQALGRLVHKKTQGNPFFINKLLVTLHKDEHIRPIETNEGAGWVCNMEAIQMANYTSNVVDLMITALRGLPENVQTMMGMAAIIGNQCKLSLLARLCDLPEHQVEASLRGAVRDGFLIPSSEELLCPTLEEDMQSGEIVLINMDNTQVSNYTRTKSNSPPPFGSPTQPTYFFAHDRIQQAAACLLSKEEQLQAHIRLAEQLLLFTRKIKSTNLILIQIAHHVNIGFANQIPPSFDLSVVTPQKIGEELELYLPFNIVSIASINFLAATKARAINAFHLGQECSNESIRLLEIDAEKHWSEQYDLCMDAYKLQADLQCITGNLTAPRCDHLLSHAKTNVEKADIYLLLHRRCEAENSMAEALDAALKGLELLGVSFPTDEEEQQKMFLADIKLLQERITHDNVSELLYLPDCTDKVQLMIFKLLSTAWISGYMQATKFITGLIATRSVIRTLDFGACPSTGKFFCSLALNGLAHMTNYPLVNEIAKVGITIGDTRFSYDKSEGGCVYAFYAAGIAAFVYPLREVMKYFDASAQLFKQGGNTLWRTYTDFYSFEVPIFFGTNLKEVINNQYKKSCMFWKEEGMKKFAMYKFAESAALPLHELRGKEYDLLGGETFEASLYHKVPLIKCGYNFNKGFVSYVLRKRDDLLAYADVATEISPSCFTGLYKLIEVEMMSGLVYIDWLGRTPLAWKTYSQNSVPYNKVPWDNSEYQSEEDLDIKTQKENLERRVKQIGYNIRHLMLASKYCCTNFFHKVYLLRAEFARVALAYDSNEIYDAANITDLSEHETVPCKAKSRSFEEAMAFYECAIESAQKFGFQQYEALGLELYGLFWMTAPPKPHIRFAYMYLSEAVMVYERWGATEKAQQLRGHIASISSFDPCIKQNIMKKKVATVSSLDLDVIVQASQTISNEADIDTLVIKMVKAIVEHANAQRGTFFIGEEEITGKVQLAVCAEYDYLLKAPLDGQTTTGVLETAISLLQPKIPLTQWRNGPQSVVNYVCRTLKPVVLKCAHDDAQFGSDAYIAAQMVKSVICMPILLKNTLKGVMYLENNLCDNIFNKNRVDLLKVLTSQMAISLENIRFLHDQMEKQSQQIIYEHLQEEEKAQRERADAAEKYKMQLENFIDMICHEIRNPLNGIFGNTDLILTYLSSLHDVLYKPNEDGRESPPKLDLDGSPNNSVPASPALTAITEFADLEDKSDTGILKYILEQVIQSTESIQKCAEHQKCMTDDVLHLSRLRSHKLNITSSFYSPCDTISNAINIFKPQAESKSLYLKVNSEGDYSHVELLGDPVRVYQIISNFLSNSLKFTHSGGITINLSIKDGPTLQSSGSFRLEKPSKELSNTPLLRSSSFSSYSSNSSSSLSSSSSSSLSSSSSSSTSSSTPTSPVSPTSPCSKTPVLDYLSTLDNSVPLDRSTTMCVLRISVEDTGIGMTPEEQSRIFKRFSQANNRTSQEYGGSGLGLAICRKLAKLMKGTISMQSNMGKGSMFTLTIPCLKAVSAPSPHLSSSPSVLIKPSSTSLLPDPYSLQRSDSSVSLSSVDSSSSADTSPTFSLRNSSSSIGSSISTASSPALSPMYSPTIIDAKYKRILVVEDNIVNQNILKRVLKLKGYVVEVANNGQEALDKYKEHTKEGSPFGFVLMDMMMPVMDGLTSSTLIRKYEEENGLCKTRIIGLSGNARDEYRQNALNAGMDEYITKPYHKEVLYKLLENIT